MSAPKHTPGPWSVEDPLGPEILSIVAGGPQVYDWTHIAQISTEGNSGEGDPSTAQAKANAALIAAAPDMLAALHAAKQMIDVALPGFDWGKSALGGEQIRLLNETPKVVARAIAKAEAGL